MKRISLLLFVLSYIAIFAWCYHGSRRDARGAPSSRFEVVALVDEGGTSKPVLLRWDEWERRRAGGEKLALLIPKADEPRIRQALQNAVRDEEGDSVELRVEPLGPDRQRITLETERESFGGSLQQTSAYEATGEGVQPQWERTFVLSFVLLVAVAVLAALTTGAAVVGGWLFVWVRAQVRRRRAAGG